MDNEKIIYSVITSLITLLLILIRKNINKITEFQLKTKTMNLIYKKERKENEKKNN